MKPATHSFYTDAVRRVIEHVVTHLGEALALETLAEQACLSPFHFHRVFRGMVGETPLELVRRLRLERAALWSGWRPMFEDPRDFVPPFRERARHLRRIRLQIDGVIDRATHVPHGRDGPAFQRGQREK